MKYQNKYFNAIPMSMKPRGRNQHLPLNLRALISNFMMKSV
ncbi:hypothetical protein T11_2918 [Trichinella zimbabwensis]|uniref:Uncharacterized protein n=1 Tax=Trichinella zimbabwensis TaxID=268475 RepID=A0A0V1GCK5_9BILA|nr:hypothetical protein T11_2918 [Trichinella zimbabwensis]